jgi:predicted lipoprotein with Yx(FWY)xxD motif
MQHRSMSIFSGAIALAGFVGLGAGAAGATPPAHGASTAISSTAPSVKTLIRLQSIGKPATLHTAVASVNGKTESILVDAKGLPLYYYQADTAKKSLVSGELARLWPPLLSAKPTATGTQGKLTALKVANGHQVTYNGHFLYTFIDDSPGHATGQGVSNFFLATPRLKAIGGAAKPAAPMPAAATSHGYGY